MSTQNNETIPSLQDMLFAERMIYKEVYTILTQNHVNDRANLFIRVTRSLWLGFTSLQVRDLFFYSLFVLIPNFRLPMTGK